MKRLLLIIFTSLLIASTASAAHIKGGFFTYRYLGPGAGTNLRYQITLTVYMICNPSSAQLDNPINFSIFDGGSNAFLQNVSVALTGNYQLAKLYDEPCITGDQRGCYYQIITYDLPSIELPANPEGYIIAYQRCCRIAGIVNVQNSGAVGNTFTIKIPGSGVMPGAETNSSPVFLVNDTAVVCAGSYFQYSFAATDPNNDSLTYTFCAAYNGADSGPPNPPQSTPPPFSTIPYASPYAGSQPMGSGVTINRTTGLISGNAPNVPGQYVLCVCVNEFRNGTLISTTRKELHVTVGDCDPLQAILNPRNATCDGFTVSFQNEATNNPPGSQYQWIFGDPASGSLDTSLLPTPTHTFTDTGVYIVRLKISIVGGLCADSTTQVVRVFPGFFPGFKVTGGCYNNPFLFTDTTKTAYGVVNTWFWDFGDGSTLGDTSHIRNPTYTYPSAGTVTARLVVTNSKGCIDTADMTFDILDKPALSVAFPDTLICRNDAVQLQANGTGNFMWTPPVNIVNANTATPTVSPQSNQWYFVDLDDNGCFNRDSVFVRVVNSVSLTAMADTTICEGDTIQLHIITDGLQYSWTPAANLDDPTSISPIAVTTTPTTYTVVSMIGGCSATDDIFVDTKPYPGANAGPPQSICYNTSAQLNASISGIRFNWRPTKYLSDSTILNPIASPPRTTQYILAVFDTLGCPKPGLDTIVVTVNPKLHVSAGNDTTVVINQPLQFNGTGAVNYLWSPTTGLSDPAIGNPIGIYGPAIDSIRYKLVGTDSIGCADSAYVTVYVFRTIPYVFVPTAFTPNNDGLNDVVRPICVGIQKLNYFQVFNRWGQRVFMTSVNKAGWDGKVLGKDQGSGVYVWIVSAVDYLGKNLYLKGTVTLIR
jgi:gliding motility-associated-like protein